MAKKLLTIGDFVSTGLVLGRGAFGTVYSGFHKKTQTPVAIKELDLDKLKNHDKNKKMRSHLHNEIKIMSKLDNVNVVRLLDCKIENKLLYLVIEFCSSGNFETYLRSKPNKRLSEDEAKYFMKQFANGLLALRKLKAIHRDLKPENLLLTAAADGSLLLKIADFGFARLVEEDQSDPLKGLIETFCGTPLYSAPEIFTHKAYTVKSDLWSIGMILYQMLYGRHPFQDSTTWPDFLFATQNQPITYPPDIPISDQCRSLLEGLLQRDIKIRFSWDEFFTHPFIDLPLSDQPSDAKSNPKIENQKNEISNNENKDGNNNKDLKDNNERKEIQIRPSPPNPEMLKQTEERIIEQFSYAKAVAALANKMIQNKRESDALALFCKSLQILQTILNCAIKNIEFLNPSDELFISYSQKIEEMKVKFGEYLCQSEELNRNHTPSVGVEGIIYYLAMEYSQKALKEEVDKNYPLCVEYYEFSLALLSQLKSDGVVEADINILEKYISTIKYRISKVVTNCS